MIQLHTIGHVSAAGAHRTAAAVFAVIVLTDGNTKAEHRGYDATASVCPQSLLMCVSRVRHSTLESVLQQSNSAIIPVPALRMG